MHSSATFRGCCALLYLITVCSASSSSAHSVPDDLIKWIQSMKHGKFNEKQTLGEYNKLFADRPISKDELLLQVPWDAILQDEEEQTVESYFNCGLVDRLAHALGHGKDSTSDFKPYVEYLLDQMDARHHQPQLIPSDFSDFGKELLLDLLGEDEGLPPFAPVEWIEEWAEDCQGDPTDDASRMAAIFFLQKDYQNMMIPVYDFYQHRNGPYTNTYTSMDAKYGVQVFASRNIQKGEQLYRSYNKCEGCEEVFEQYGTAEIFRDRGIVEEFPQKWCWEVEGVCFELVNDNDGRIKVQWTSELPKMKGYYFQLVQAFRKKVLWLQKIKTLSWNLHLSNVQDWGEWNLIWEYQDALLKAFANAHDSLEKDEELHFSIEDQEAGQEVCASDSAKCVGPISNHYDDLDDRDDELDYVSPTCDNSEWMLFEGYHTLWEKQTSYQHAMFNRNNETGDVCMDIDEIVQICSCYRPHYHEFSANFPARFLESVRRVLFVGGGDSMLLHEALKYPSLEKVVGLELDQVITRKSFQYFHTQPHFDDRRVEWWFGDATKSLLLLPKEYWGSFDLVLVDLSETAMALSVTDGLDVFDALALILKPEGIMVKNELYIEEMSDVFDYTIQIKYDSPKICSQLLAMGSNRVDFFRQTPKDHDIHNFLIQPVEEMDNIFEYMHDYRKNDARAQGKCDDLADTTSDPEVQGRSAGILHVMDIEKAEGIQLEEALSTAIQKAGLTTIATPTHDIVDENLAIVVLSEGYIVARRWNDQDYVAVGVNLWGSFHKFDSFQTHLLKAFKTSSLSLFRVVVGGMYGSTTWKEDQPLIGPQVVQNRNCDDNEATRKTQEKPVTEEMVSEVVIDEVLSNLLPEEDMLIVGVVCGFEFEDICVAKSIMEKTPRVEKVVTFWACPELKSLGRGEDNAGDGISQGDLTAMFACEKAMILQMEEDAADVYFDVFVLDRSSPYVMAQVFNSIWNIPKYRRLYIEEDRNLFMGISSDPTLDFQRNFLDRYRTDVRYDPAARAEFIVPYGSGATMEIGIVSVGDEVVFQSLSAAERKIKARLDVEIELRKIHGAQWNFREDLEPKEFSQDDYDGTPGKLQFLQQKPLGRETVFQLIRNPDSKDSDMMALSLEGLASHLDKCLSKLGWTRNGKMKKSTIIDTVGDGGLIVSISKEGHAVLTWDGRDHVDINLFNFNDSEEIADSFVQMFVNNKHYKNLMVALRDDYPRGTGRVVNFRCDISESC